MFQGISAPDISSFDVSGMQAPGSVEHGNDIDLSEFKFSKFAAMYFQGNATHTHIRKALRQPLLQLNSEGDQLVSMFITKNTVEIAVLLEQSGFY